MNHMKRIIALVLCALMLAGLFAGCGGGEEEPTTTVPLPTTTDPATEAMVDLEVPEGYVEFGTVDDENIVTVRGATYLLNAVGDTRVLDKNSKVTANLYEGKITSVTDENDESFSVFVGAYYKDEGRLIYGREGNPADDPSTIDIGDLNDGSTAAKITTTTKKTTTTAKPLPTVPKVTTTKPPTMSPEEEEIKRQQENIKNNPNMSQAEKRAALNLLSYKVDKNGIFYVEHQPWQKQFGFNEIYDRVSPLIQLIYSTIRVKFRYGYVYKLYESGDKKGQVMYGIDGKPVYETDASGKPIPKDWMVQLWKGRYGLVMLGAEFGVYTKPSTQNAEHYYSAVAEEELVMAMDVYQQNFLTGTKKHLFTRGPESHWWLTGFVSGTFHQNNNKSEIICVANIQFPNQEMLKAFETPFAAAGFKLGSPGRDTPETYLVSGNSIKFSWQYIDQDS